MLTRNVWMLVGSGLLAALATGCGRTSGASELASEEATAATVTESSLEGESLLPDLTEDILEELLATPVASDSRGEDEALPLAGFTVEGDMMMSLAQIKEFYADGARGFELSNTVRSKVWPKGVVVYAYAPSFTRTALFEQAIKHWEDNTQIRFKKRTNEADYVLVKGGTKCQSWIGKQGGAQDMTLAGGCGLGAMIHEIGHAVGLYHEQSRSDRDQFVTIHWDNIKEANKFNFRIGGVARGAYDYASIMHYGSHDFTVNGKATIVPKRSGVTIGQRRGLSAADREQVDRLYAAEVAARPAVGPTQPTQPTQPTRPTAPAPGVTPSSLALKATYLGRSGSNMRFQLHVTGTAGTLAAVRKVTYDIHATFGAARYQTVTGASPFRSKVFSTYAKGWKTGAAKVELTDGRVYSVPGASIDW